MDGTVAKLILDSLDRNENHEGTLGGVFLKYVDKIKSAEPPTEESEKDAELVRKLTDLKQCELNKDLAWFDYGSWNVLTREMRDYFHATLDPLYYGGVFFQYSKFLQIEDLFWNKLPSTHSVTVLNDYGNYHIHCVGENDNRYDHLGIQALQKLQKDFNRNLLVSIGTTSDGQIVKIDRRKQPNGQK